MTKTQLVEAHQISKNHRYFKECDDLAFRSKNLWNATNYAVRQHYFNTGKHLPYEVVNKQFTIENQPDYRALPAKVSKGTQRLLEKSYKSFFKKSGFRRPPGYLHKTDGRMVVHYEKGALRTTVPGWIQLSKTHLFIKTDRKADFVRIVPKLDYYVIEVGYSVETPAPSETTGRVAAIDLGFKVILQKESYTSKSSFYSLDPIPIFGIKNEVTFKGIRMCRGLYKDASGQKLNADLNGSLNILRKSSAWLDDMFEACVYFSKQPFITRSF